MAKSSLLKKENFQSTEYCVAFYNITTQTQVADPTKLKISELGNNWFSLKLPKKSCNIEHHLFLHIFKDTDSGKIIRKALNKNIDGAISIISVVKELETIDSDNVLAKLIFLQFNEQEWKEFLERWKTIQKDVDSLMKRIKG